MLPLCKEGGEGTQAVNRGIGHPGCRTVQEEQIHTTRQGFAKQREGKSQGPEELRRLLMSAVWGCLPQCCLFFCESQGKDSSPIQSGC